MPRYFLTENSKVAVKSDNLVINFVPHEFVLQTNSWWGIYSTESAEELALLDQWLAAGRIAEISAEDFANLDSKKKSESDLKLSIPLQPPSVIQNQVAPVTPAEDAPVKKTIPAASLEQVLTPKRSSSKK